MFDFDVPFDDMGLRLADGTFTGAMSGIAHCTEVDGGAVVVDISVDTHIKDPHAAHGYTFAQRMLDRTKPAERILFHQLSDAFKAAYREVIADRLAEGYADYRAHLGVDAWIDNYRGK
jgi:predicted deacylase